MRNITLLLLIGTMLAGFCNEGKSDIHTWYEGHIIQEGDFYEVIYIYDSPPDYTTVDMTGGSVCGLEHFNLSIVNIYDGFVETLSAYDLSTTNIYAGSVQSMYTYDSSTASIYDGSLSGFSAGNSSTVNIYGGFPGGFIADQLATVNIYDGFLNYLCTRGSSTVNFHGGDYRGELIAYDSSTLNFFGYDLNYNPTGGITGDGILTGLWADGSDFTINLWNGDGSAYYPYTDTYSHIVSIEVPEPATILLLGLGAMVVLRKPRS